MAKDSPNTFIYCAVFSANLLSLNTSPGFSWTSPTFPKFASNDSAINPLERPTTTLENTLLASLYHVGCVFGCILSSIMAEKYGRKTTLLLFSVPIVISYLTIAVASKITYFYIARVVLGASAGCILSVLPCYIAEITEDDTRGFFGSIFGVMGCVGHLLTFGIGPLVSVKTLAFILMVPTSLFFVAYTYCIPETPYYFLSKNQTTEAEICLKQLRRSSDVEIELLKLKYDVDKACTATWRDMVGVQSTKKGLITLSGLLIFQQLTGISFIWLYLQFILEASGNTVPSSFASIFIGFVQLLSCIASGFLIDKVGRKMLLYFSSTGCSVSLFLISNSFFLIYLGYDVTPVLWLPFVSLASFFVFYILGYGCVPFIISGELFAVNVKSVCVSFCMCINIVTGVLTSACFPYIVIHVGMGVTFLIFAICTAFGNFFVLFFVPETKGRSFIEIQKMLQN